MYNDGDNSHHLLGAKSTGNASAGTDVFPSDVDQYEYMCNLVIDDNKPLLDHRSFGVVLRGMLYGVMDVAIKKLHESQLSKKDRKMFIKETLMLDVLDKHPNIVQLYGYTLTPLAIVMEYVPRGSLSFLLHYCEDPQAEAKMTGGRVKLNLLLVIAHGMAQLYARGVTHGDLKPQNVLVSDDFRAKIADFGLATFRAKTSSTTSSHVLHSCSLSSSIQSTGTSGTAAVGVSVCSAMISFPAVMIGGNCSMDRVLANKMRMLLTHCRSHKLNLAISSLAQSNAKIVAALDVDVADIMP